MFAGFIEDVKKRSNRKFDTVVLERNFLLLNQIRDVRDQLKILSRSLNNIQICGKGILITKKNELTVNFCIFLFLRM